VKAHLGTARVAILITAVGRSPEGVNLHDVAADMALDVTSVLAYARTLARHGYLAHQPNDLWILGPAIHERAEDRATQLRRYAEGSLPVLRPRAPSTHVGNTARQELTARCVAMYTKEGLSIDAIAQKTGRSYGLVHRLLGEAGVTMRPRGGART
jgi:DNA-binding IclR family transcriptional regulator